MAQADWFLHMQERMGPARAQRLARWILETLLVALLAGTLVLVGLARLAPAMGHPVFIIRSGSMVPAIPVGAAVVLDRGAAGVRIGDVVSLRLDDGAIFTHRVTRLVQLDKVPYVATKGDANRAEDPALTPLSQVIGRVGLTVPLAGFLMAGLARPAGVATALLAALTLLAALWLLDEDEAAVRGPARPHPARAVRPRCGYGHPLEP
ncbi:MAG: signal peptidase I [Candidatus Limnocylindrales bacterium]